MFLHLSARPPTCAPLPFKSPSHHSPRARRCGPFSLYCSSFTPCTRPDNPNSPQSPDGMNDSLFPTAALWTNASTHTHTHTYRTNKTHCCRHFTQTHLCPCFLNTSDFLESRHVEILSFFGWTWQALLNKQIKRLSRNQNLHIAWIYLKFSKDNQIMMQLSKMY